MSEELICIVQHSNLWKIKLVCIKLVEEDVWSECEIRILTSGWCEDNAGLGLKHLVSRQIRLTRYRLECGFLLEVGVCSSELRVR